VIRKKSLPPLIISGEPTAARLPKNSPFPAFAVDCVHEGKQICYDHLIIASQALKAKLPDGEAEKQLGNG
jgi:hypothetical protein